MVLDKKKTWFLTFTETIRLIRDREKEGKGMAVGEEALIAAHLNAGVILVVTV